MHCGRVGRTPLSASLTFRDPLSAGECYNRTVYRYDCVGRFEQFLARRHELLQPYSGTLPAHDCANYLVEYKPVREGYDLPLPEAVARFRSAGVQHFNMLARRNQLRRHVSHKMLMRSRVLHPHRRPDQPTRAAIDLEHVSDCEIDFGQGSLLHVLDHWKRALCPSWDGAMDEVGTWRLIYENLIGRDTAVGCRQVVRFLSLAEGWEPARLSQTRQNAWPSRRSSPSHLEG
jgi:hypothetical protein